MSQPVATVLVAVAVAAVAGVLVGLEWVGAWLLFVAPILVAPLWTTLALKPWSSSPPEQDGQDETVPRHDALQTLATAVEAMRGEVSTGRTASEATSSALVIGVQSMTSDVKAIRTKLTELVSPLQKAPQDPHTLRARAVIKKAITPYVAAQWQGGLSAAEIAAAIGCDTIVQELLDELARSPVTGKKEEEEEEEEEEGVDKREAANDEEEPPEDIPSGSA